MNTKIDLVLNELSTLLKKIISDGGCDYVNQTTYFKARIGKIYAITSNEDDSRILSENIEGTTYTGKTYNSIARVDTVTLTGTAGTANVLCNGTTKLATFATSLTQTALNFVSTHAADYLTAGVVVTANAGVLYFTATVAGTDFTGSTTITNASDDLSGTVATSTTNSTIAINDNKTIYLDNPIDGFTPAKGSFWVYYRK